jgi:hypothetical protein
VDNVTPPEFLSTIDSRTLKGPLMRVKLTRLRGGGCVLGAGPYMRYVTVARAKTGASLHTPKRLALSMHSAFSVT